MLDNILLDQVTGESTSLQGSQARQYNILLDQVTWESTSLQGSQARQHPLGPGDRGDY